MILCRRGPSKSRLNMLMRQIMAEHVYIISLFLVYGNSWSILFFTTHDIQSELICCSLSSPRIVHHFYSYLPSFSKMFCFLSFHLFFYIENRSQWSHFSKRTDQRFVVGIQPQVRPRVNRSKFIRIGCKKPYNNHSND